MKKGFSLIETLVAVTVLVGAITGPLTLASQGIKAASLFKNQLIASNLAQEGMELGRSRRDSNVLRAESWLTNLETVCLTACSVRYDPRDNSAAQVVFISCPSGECPKFYITPEGFYVQKSNPDVGDQETIFTRTIQITNVNVREVKITSRVTWQERFSQQSIVLEENLLNWP
ncbi:MAG: prepilin-type N-terminal cleavage/methylation domain-containing protein [Patescibacteria group bacterium]